MNKLTKWVVPGFAFCSIFAAGAQQINPMTEAVLKQYSDYLSENPKDYVTLFDRASQYFSIGENVRALSDIDMALEYTPAKETSYRLAEYSLKSDILTAQKDYDGAIEAVKAALAIDPSSKSDLYKAGNLYLLTNKPQEALGVFQSLQRESPRSQEAFYGMAKANVMMGNPQEAENLIKEIEALGKQSFVTYCRIGDLYSDMGNVKEAATNYAIAYSMEDTNPRPIESLKLLERKNPALVMETLESLIVSKPDNLALQYLKAILAFDAGLYAEAEKACKELAANLEEDSPAVYRMMAMAQLAQNKRAESKQSIETAEKLSPGNIDILQDKAEILFADDPQGAYDCIVQVLTQIPDDQSALLIGAKTAMAAGKYPEAQNYLNHLVLSNPSNVEALLLRGFLNTEYLKDGKAGVADYTRAGSVQPNGDLNTMILVALGKSKINKKLDADGLIKDVTSKSTNNKNTLYLLAVYYAQTGNLEKAKEYADLAVANGYGNLYNLQSNPQPLINLVPIQHLMK